MRVRMALLMASLGMLGCGNDVTLGGSEAKGSVGGVVLDGTAGFPALSGATVTVIAGGNTYTATTDMNGTFAVRDVPSGSVVVKLSSPDHFDAYFAGTLASNAGNFPVSNASLTVGPIVMLSSQGTLALRLVDEKGAAAPNVSVTARVLSTYIDLSSNTPVPKGGTEALGKSGPDGLVTIGGVPDFAAIGPVLPDNITVNIPPQKLMGDSGYQFLGLTLNLNATQYSPAIGQTPTVVLAGPHTALTVLSSNVDYLETNSSGPVASVVNGPVTVAFNQAVNGGTLKVQLITETGALAQAMATPTVAGNLLTVAFSKPLDPATRYNLTIHAESAYGGDQPHEYNNTAPFFTPPMQGSTFSALPNSSRMDPNDPNQFIVEFSEPIGLGNGRSDAVPCVVYYDTSLDGNPMVVSPGEYIANANDMLKCETNGAHPGLYLRPDEPTFGSPGGSPLTGFTAHWRLYVRPPFTCTNINNYQCNTSSSTVHFVFSRQNDPSFVVKRTNGQPAADTSVTLPSF